MQQHGIVFHPDVQLAVKKKRGNANKGFSAPSETEGILI